MFKLEDALEQVLFTLHVASEYKSPVDKVFFHRNSYVQLKECPNKFGIFVDGNIISQGWDRDKGDNQVYFYWDIIDWLDYNFRWNVEG